MPAKIQTLDSQGPSCSLGFPTDTAGKWPGAEWDVPFAGAGAGHIWLGRGTSCWAGQPGQGQGWAGVSLHAPSPWLWVGTAVLASTGAPAGPGMGHPWLPVAGS